MLVHSVSFGVILYPLLNTSPLHFAIIKVRMSRGQVYTLSTFTRIGVPKVDQVVADPFFGKPT